METERTFEESDEAATAEQTTPSDQGPQAQKLIGFIIAAILIFLAQRDLRKRRHELVRGPVGLWRALEMVPPGAVAYLVIGRRRAVTIEAIEVPNSIAA